MIANQFPFVVRIVYKMHPRHEGYIRSLQTESIINILQKTQYAELADLFQQFNINGDDLLDIKEYNVILKFGKTHQKRVQSFQNLLNMVQATPEELFPFQPTISRKPTFVARPNSDQTHKQSTIKIQSELASMFSKQKSRSLDEQSSKEVPWVHNMKPTQLVRQTTSNDNNNHPTISDDEEEHYKTPMPLSIIPKNKEVLETSSMLSKQESPNLHHRSPTPLVEEYKTPIPLSEMSNTKEASFNFGTSLADHKRRMFSTKSKRLPDDHKTDVVDSIKTDSGQILPPLGGNKPVEVTSKFKSQEIKELATTGDVQKIGLTLRASFKIGKSLAEAKRRMFSKKSRTLPDDNTCDIPDITKGTNYEPRLISSRRNKYVTVKKIKEGVPIINQNIERKDNKLKGMENFNQDDIYSEISEVKDKGDIGFPHIPPLVPFRNNIIPAPISDDIYSEIPEEKHNDEIGLADISPPLSKRSIVPFNGMISTDQKETEKESIIENADDGTPGSKLRYHKFYRDISRDEGVQLLESKRVGTYLFRSCASQDNDYLGILMVHGEMAVKNFPVCYDHRSSQFYLASSHDWVTIRFKNLNILLDYYAHNVLVLGDKLVKSQLNDLD